MSSAFEFGTMPKKTRAAFALFVAAKFCGMFGVILGYVPGTTRYVGGAMLVAAAVSLIASLTLSVLQLKHDGAVIDEENEEISRINALKNSRIALEREVEALRTKSELTAFVTMKLKPSRHVDLRKSALV